MITSGLSIERKDTLIKGHLNVSQHRVMGRNIAFKMQFGENILAQQMTDIKRSLCSQQIPFIDAYMEMDPRGIVKMWSYNSHQEASSPGKTGKYSDVMVFHFEKKKKNRDE